MAGRAEGRQWWRMSADDEQRAAWQTAARPSFDEGRDVLIDLFDDEAGRKVRPYYDKLRDMAVLSSCAINEPGGALLNRDETLVVLFAIILGARKLASVEGMAVTEKYTAEIIADIDEVTPIDRVKEFASRLIVRQGLCEAFEGSRFDAWLSGEVLDVFRGICAGDWSDEEAAKLQPLIDYMEQTETGQAVKLELSRNQEPERRPKGGALLRFVCGPDKETNCAIATECISYQGGKKLALIVKSLQRNGILIKGAPPSFSALKKAGATCSQTAFNKEYNHIELDDLDIDREVRDVIRKHTTKL